MPKRRNEDAPYWRQLRLIEKAMLENALRSHISVRDTAKSLGVSPNYVSERLAALGITAPRTKPGPKPKNSPTKTPPQNLPTKAPPPMPSAFEHYYYGGVADSLITIIVSLVNGADSSVMRDCRFVANLVHRGICAPREAATMMHRLLVQITYGPTPGPTPAPPNTRKEQK